MTPKAQRIAIARAHKAAKGSRWWDFLYETPDYLRDLNAIHSAILSRSENEMDEIAKTLSVMLKMPVEKALIHATAAQRAEAFLRTIGKWRDHESASGKVVAI